VVMGLVVSEDDRTCVSIDILMHKRAQATAQGVISEGSREGSSCWDTV
jgi:hypothetical protein